MLVDTGSAVTIIREDAWKRSAPTSTTERNLQEIARPVVTANGERITILGQATVPLQVGTLEASHSVLVAVGITHECILGTDFLNRHGCLVDLRNHTLVLGEERIPLRPKSQNVHSVCHCTFAETSVIPGSCQVQLPTQLATTGIPDDCVGMVEPAAEFSTRHGLLVARSLSIVQSGMELVRVLNPSSAPVTVYRNQKVGVLHPLADTDQVNSLEPQECPLPQHRTEVPAVMHSLMSRVTAGTSEEHSHLQSLLEEFSDVFSLGDHSQHYTGHIDCGNNVLGIIQSFDFDLANLEGHEQCNHLQNCLVAIENAQGDITQCRHARVEEVLVNDLLFLLLKKGRKIHINTAT